jgi:glucokinase
VSVGPRSADVTVLGCDLGGTNLRMELWRGRRLARAERMQSAHIEDLARTLRAFAGDAAVDAVGLSLAGPVLGERCQITNLSFVVDAAQLRKVLKTKRVALLNDLSAHALGSMRGDVVQQTLGAQAVTTRNGALLFAMPGTGWGSVVVIGAANGPIAVPAEAGHADFAVFDEQTYLLQRYLREAGEPTSREGVLAASKLHQLYAFCTHNQAPRRRAITRQLAGADVNAQVLALRRRDPVAKAAVELYLQLLARELGNLACTHLATGGVLFGGVLAAPLQADILSAKFCGAVFRPSPVAHVFAQTPVTICTVTDAALLGARRAALKLLQS